MPVFLSIPIILLLFLSCNNDPGYEIYSTEKTMTASSNGYTYKIYIMYPENAGPQEELQTVYLLDADMHMERTADLFRKHNKRVVLVGIGHNTNESAGSTDHPRFIDFTPTVDTVMSPNGGGAELFIDFITEQLIPQIENVTPASTSYENRALFGHSLGGLFTFYTLLSHPDLFGRYVAADSTTSWGGGVLFYYEKERAVSGGLQGRKLYTTNGSYGNFGATVLFWEELLNRM